MEDSAPVDLTDLPTSARRRLMILTAVRSIVLAAGLTVAYYVMPIGADSGRALVIGIVVGMAIVVGVIVAQVFAILSADYPMLRAIVGLAAAIPTMLLVFAATYMLMSAENAGAFNEELNHTGALYLAVTTGTTVGFGDITAVTDSARVVVMLQMISNVVVIGAGVRLMLMTARNRSRINTVLSGSNQPSADVPQTERGSSG